MDNQQLLNIQLEKLRKVSRDLELVTDDRVLKKIKDKRADITRRTYAALARQSRYNKAVSFLAEDLLGGNHLSARGGELARARKPMAKMLPDALLGTVARSVEFTAITLSIEMALAAYLEENKLTMGDLTDETYLAALRAAVSRELLERQSSLVVLVGEEIESVVNRPFIATALKMCRTPAQLMGLGDLQDFLERGFDAFRSMRGSREFIELFSRRESELIRQIYSTQSNPFSL
jgi:hypothetical protein